MAMNKFFAWLDNLLDATVLFSFSNLGYFLRRPFWRRLAMDSVDGKSVVITGGSGGIGFYTALRLAEAGARVIIISSNWERSRDAVERIRSRTNNPAVHGIVADMGDPAQVDRAIEETLQQFPVIDRLILNAGILPATRQSAPGGVERTVAVNLMGPHRYLAGVMDRLEQSNDPRVMLVSSGGMYGVGMDMDAMLNPPEPFDGVRAYAYTKRAQVMLTQLYARRLTTDVRFASLHPGWVRTPGLKTSLPGFYRWMYLFLRTLHQGSDTLLWLCTIDRERFDNGAFWFDRRQRGTVRLKSTRPTETQEEQLWQAVSRSL